MRSLRDPSAGTILKAWDPKMGKCQWCVFLRFVEPASSDSSDEDDQSEGGGAAESGGAAAGGQSGRVARVAGGDSRSMKPRDVPLSSLVGWSNEPEALEALQTANFDEGAALALLAADYEACGYWRDKFKAWDSAEAEMLCDAVS